MIVLFLAVICLVLLALLYHYMPSRKVFYFFTLSLVLTACVAYFANQVRTEEPVLTEAEKYEIQIQQKIFMDWYASYQKKIDQLDRHWQWYHAIAEDFQEESIDIQTAYLRLKQLEEDSRLLRDQIHEMAPPEAMHDPCYDLMIEIIRKTNVYAEAQLRTIILSRAVIDPAHLQTDDPAEQRQSLKDVMIKESPVGLFTANEISQIKNNLTIPETTVSQNESSPVS